MSERLCIGGTVILAFAMIAVFAVDINSVVGLLKITTLSAVSIAFFCASLAWKKH
jgi:hypothetical protein